MPAELYNAIYAHVLSRPDIAELTVEDPAEAFEDLRDRNDLKMLLAHSQFMEEGFGGDGMGASHGGGRVVKSKGKARVGATKGKGKMGPPTEKGWAEKWRKDLKIALVRAPTHNLQHSKELIDVALVFIAAIPAPHRDAYHPAHGSYRCAGGARVQAASERATVSV